METKRKNVFCLAIGLLAVLMIAGTGLAQTKWDLPAAYPITNFHSVNLQKFVDNVKERSGGKLLITPHYGASLFKLPEIKRAVQTGQAQIGEVLMPLLSNESAIYEIDNIPFLAPSLEESWKLYQAQRPFVEKHLDAQGLKLLFAVSWPTQGIYSNRELKTIKDMEGLAWRAYSPATMRIAELVRAQPVTIQMAELSQALSTGKVNAMMTSAATGMESKAWEQIKYFYDAQICLTKNMVMVNETNFRKLDKATQDILVAESKKAEDTGWKATKKYNDDALETLKKNGMVVQAPSPELKKGLAEVGKIMLAEWLNKAGADGEKLLEAYRKQ